MKGGAAFAVLVGAALIGLAPIGVRLSDIPPVATNLWRFLFALPVLALWASQEQPAGARDRGWLIGAGLFFGLELNLWAVALTQTTVTNATLLANMTPVFAAVFGWFVFKERLGAGVYAGGATALAGAVVLALARAQSGQGPEGGDAGFVGDAMGLGAAMGYAAYLLIVRAIGERVGVGTVMFWASLTGAVFSLALALLLGEPLLPYSIEGWAILIGLGLVVQAAGQGLIAYGVGRLPIVISTVLLWMQPLAAAVLSWILFGEELGPLALFGAALILAGLFAVQRARVRVAA
jgi:drug/metabolite transporter (DMT)-like permease